MSDLKLVSPDQPTPLEQRLLDAVANESPSAEQRTRVRLALGLAAVAPSPVLVPPGGRGTLLLKAAGGVIAVSAAMLALFLAIGHEPSAGKPPETEQTPSAQPGVASVVPLAVPAESSATSEAAAPSAASAPALSAPALGHDDSAPSRRASKATVADSGTDLSEQLRLIDAARSAVAAGKTTAASTALNSYRTRFPRGPFGQEAAVLQIQTFDLQGNHALAASQARSFLARYPNSPHASVVRRIAER